MKHLLLLCCLLCSTSLHAFQFTQDHAMEIAKQLYQKEILSEKGQNILLARLKAGKLVRMRQPTMSDGEISMVEGAYASTFLQFCTEAFLREFSFRMALEERKKIMMALYNQNLPDKEFDRVYQEEIAKVAAIQIEVNIPWEDAPPTKQWSSHMNAAFDTNSDDMPTQLVHANRSVTGKTRSRTLKELLEIGLINETIYQEIATQLEGGNVIPEYELLQMAAQRMIVMEDFDYHKQDQLKLIDRLVTYQVLSPSQKESLIESYRPFELKHKFDFLPYCRQQQQFNVVHLSADPQLAYSTLMKELFSLIPNFNYQQLTVRVDSTTLPHSAQKGVCISFQSDEITYQHLFLQSFKPEHLKKNAGDTVLLINNTFYQGINKWLTDQQSPYRLYFAHQPFPRDPKNKEKFALLLLSQQQFNAWGMSNSDPFIYPESHDNTFTTDHIQHIIQVYDSLGLFSHLSPEELAKAQNGISLSSISRYRHILGTFPRMYANFSWKIVEKNPYERTLQRFAAISRGVFDPDNIVDNYQRCENEPLWIFYYKGKSYAKPISCAEGWMLPEGFELIEEALKENQINGRFYACYSWHDGDIIRYLFLTNEQYTYLKQHQPSLFEED